MSLNNKHHREMILKYHQNKLSPNERHQLEMEALDDPFLNDALEGFELSPSEIHLHEIESVVSQQVNSSGGGSFYTLFIAPAVILIGLSLVVNPLFMGNDEKQHSDHPKQITDNSEPYFFENTSPEEIAIEDKQLDAAKELPKKEWLENISEETIKDAPIKNTLPDIKPINSVKINIPDKIEDTIEIKKTLKKYQHPVYFLYDLKVANYRNFRSGDLWTEHFNNSVSANFENNTSVTKENQVDKVSYAEYLDGCMKNYVKGKLKIALRGYKTILKNYPDDANALFYGGLTAYNLGFTDSAIELLEKSFNHPFGVFSQESEWLWSLALLKNGAEGKSLEIMHSIANSDHFYSEHAKKKISDLTN